MPKDIIICEELKKKALNHTLERINFEFDRFKLNLEQRKDMILIGTIGQLIFKKYLEENNIPFEFEFQAGNYDNLDFKINSKIVEIKTSGFDDNWNTLNLLYSSSQLKRGLKKNYSYCVQIFIDGYNRNEKKLNLELCKKSIIFGGIQFIKINSFKNKKKFYGDDYKVPLDKLVPIEDLLNEILAV